MRKTKMLRRGAVSVFQIALLAGCASSPAVQTRTEYVDRPVAVAIPAKLTEPVADAPVPVPLTNDDLVGLAEGEKCRRILANCQLDRIEALQPGGARRPAVWCVRYERVCRGVK